jgi:effector-binding domain-containing protein
MPGRPRVEQRAAQPYAAIDEVPSGDGRVRVETLPGGRYVTACHVGPFDGLIASHEALQRWAREQEVVWDSWTTERGEAWRSRVEHYVTDPATEPDPSKWEVELAYLMADG